jgi:PAS domain S-box-containing protein
MPTKLDLQRIIDFSPAVHYVAGVSDDFATTYVSDGIQAQLGYTPDQFTQDPRFWASRIHPEDQARVLADLRTILEHGQHVHEYRFLHADGGWRWMHDESVLVRDAAGEPHQIVGSWFDITDRKEAEETHQKITSRLQEAQRIAGIGSWEMDTVTSKGWWSDETYRIFGEDPDAHEPTRERFLAKVHPDDRQRLADALERALIDGQPYSIDYRIVLPDGAERIVNGRGHGIATREGPATAFAGTVQDITERERTEQALRDAEARNRALLEANPDVIFRIDADGCYLDLSVSSKTLFPYTRAALVGQNVRNFFSQDFAREHQRYVRKAIETGETQLWVCRISLPHGDVDLEARFVRSGDNEAVVTVRDITERLTLQREIIATQERERSRIGRDLHDGLGQELTGISLGLEVLAQQLAAERSPHAEAVHNLRAMTQRSISVTRQIALSLSPGFGSALGISEALESLASEVNEHSKVRCNARCSTNGHQHDIDVETNLYRIAQEGVTNALKHGKPRNIELRYGCDGKTIQLEVLDDGIGIQPVPDRSEGMGLRSMRYRADLVNGTLEFRDGAAGGTRVLCSCPCQV